MHTMTARKIHVFDWAAPIFMFLLWVSPGYAATVEARNVTISVSLETAARPGSTIWAAIHQVIRPGWHTYWQNPGMAGLPTSINWILPQGIKAGSILWPTPERIVTGGIVDYGYRNQVTLLVPLAIASNAAPGSLPAQADISWLVCAEMCIPEEAKIDIDLSKPAGIPALFAEARAALPKPFRGFANAIYDEHTLNLNLTDPVFAGTKPEAVQFFPTTAGAIDYAARQQVRISGNELVLSVARPPQAQRINALAGILILDRARSFQIDAAAHPRAIKAAAMPAKGHDAIVSVMAAVLFAFAGGLVLNIMPCVLPVLAMKALALTRSDGDSRSLRRDGTFYFLGVLAAFGALSGGLLLFKAGGAAIGWGFQLQSPILVFWLALLMAAIGFNLLGAFELPLGFAGLGEDLTRGAGGRGAFFAGVLAALVASPCTAPFMGAALGYALIQPGMIAIAVFLSLAVGFALPMFLLAFAPSLVRLIPKPGLWTTRFKEFLAFPMFATAIWLAWVFNRQTGPSGVLLGLSIAMGLVFASWLLPFFTMLVRRIAALAAVAGLVALSFGFRTEDGAEKAGWARWSPQAVDEARRAGRPVMVDFSAAWCVTCLVNERLALSDSEVAERLGKDRVVTLKADWTSRDAAITTELEHYHRAGVPLYLLYSADVASDAIVLPQILTPGLVMKELNLLKRHNPVHKAGDQS